LRHERTHETGEWQAGDFRTQKSETF
jgi:hypothetical protein